MGDRWRSDVLGSSRYIWYPLSWSSGSPQLVAADVWSVNPSAGTYTVASGTTYEAENGTKGGSATLITSSSFSGGKGIGYLGQFLPFIFVETASPDATLESGHGGTLTLNNVQGIGQAQWLSIYFANGDSTYRNVTVSVNGGASVLVDQPDTGSGNVCSSCSVKIPTRINSSTDNPQCASQGQSE
jgi:hypothetical protein